MPDAAITKGAKTLVVIPAYNEADRIGTVMSSVRDAVSAAEILVVDDCSSDATADLAKEAGAEVVSHPVNLGYGAALETGYLYAREYDYRVVIQMDADGQHLAEEILKIMGPVLAGEADIVVGSRYLPGAGSYHASWVRRMGGIFFSVLLSLFTRRRFSDPTSGFQCMNHRVIDLFASGIFPEDFPDTDVLLIAHWSGLRIREVAVTMRDREGGVSMHDGWRPLYYVAKMILSMFIVALNHRRWRKYGS